LERRRQYNCRPNVLFNCRPNVLYNCRPNVLLNCRPNVLFNCRPNVLFNCCTTGNAAQSSSPTAANVPHAASGNAQTRSARMPATTADKTITNG
jgi:hypothetical protein